MTPEWKGNLLGPVTEAEKAKERVRELEAEVERSMLQIRRLEEALRGAAAEVRVGLEDAKWRARAA